MHTVRLTRRVLDVPARRVTNAQWLRFLATLKHQRPKYAHQARLMRPEQPAVAISYDDAVAYCRWAKVRLPTEAGGSGQRGAPMATATWGNWEPDPGWRSSSARSTWRSPEAVGTRPDGASPFGVLDMTGNAWEWTSDWYPLSVGGADRPHRAGDGQEARDPRRGLDQPDGATADDGARLRPAGAPQRAHRVPAICDAPPPRSE